MTKGNKIRLIFWGFIWLIVLVAMAFGIYGYFNGYGISGKVRNELKPVVTSFNSLNELNIYNNANIKIKAKLNKSGIKVNYKTLTSNLAYIFDYKELDGNKVLYMKYNENSENTAQIIIREMVDAISVLNNHNEGDIFNKISYDDLYELTLNEGILIKYNNGIKEVYIDTNKSVADYITEKDKEKITENDLLKMNNELKEKGFYTITRNNLILYVLSNDEKYTIYAQNNNYDDYLYKSINNLINTLDLDDKIKNSFNLNYPTISTSTEFDNYIITVDDKAFEIDVFKNKNNIIKIEILKDIKSN